MNLIEQLEEQLEQSAYCFSCDGIHVEPVYHRDPDNPGMYKSAADDTPREGDTCEGPHVPECTCTRCDAERTAEWEQSPECRKAREERLWHPLFHSKEEAENAPPISFLIQGFLQREGVTAIAGPVRERKSLIALNVAHALVTGERLFDYFEVVEKPARVLYLSPENSLGPFTDRIKAIGLMPYVGDTFFYRTLSADGHLKLNDPALHAALPGSVVFLDTAVRFFEGDENSSQDARVFADGLFALLRHGAESVVLLHHSPKSQGDGMTLENALRGSGDLGAFLTACWGTRLQDPSKPYESASYLENLKQRDFASEAFEVTSGPDCRLHIVGDPSLKTAVLQSRKGNVANRDGKDAAAEEAIRANMEMPIRKLEEHLASLGIKRGKTWVSKTRARLKYADK